MQITDQRVLLVQLPRREQLLQREYNAIFVGNIGRTNPTSLRGGTDEFESVLDVHGFKALSTSKSSPDALDGRLFAMWVPIPQALDEAFEYFTRCIRISDSLGVALRVVIVLRGASSLGWPRAASLSEDVERRLTGGAGCVVPRVIFLVCVCTAVSNLAIVFVLFVIFMVDVQLRNRTCKEL
jgi:hypothetical protein